jgi:hypothetical protein
MGGVLAAFAFVRVEYWRRCMDTQTSLYVRLIGRPQRPRLKWAIVLLLFLLPLALASREIGIEALIRQGAWRELLLPPTVIAYILWMAPRLARADTEVLRAFRPVVLLDDASYDRLVSDASHIDPRREVFAFGAGAALGLFMAARGSQYSLSWLVVVWRLSAALMYGLLFWTVQGSFAATRLTAAILRQPLQVDVLEPAPFYPIGRQGLAAALVFVGGVTLGMLFSLTQLSILLLPEFWLIFLPQLAVPVVIFFLTMASTHRVLAAAKEAEQGIVHQHLQRSFRELKQRLAQHQDTGRVTAEINALVAYDERLQRAPTWPYNTTMLRTLVFSVFIPGATLVGRVIVDVLFD